MANGLRRGPRRLVGYIFQAWITRRDRSIDWARQHGLKAWRGVFPFMKK